jgi:hypothetical protein
MKRNDLSRALVAFDQDSLDAMVSLAHRRRPPRHPRKTMIPAYAGTALARKLLIALWRDE